MKLRITARNVVFLIAYLCIALLLPYRALLRPVKITTNILFVAVEMEETWQEYEDWTSEPIPESVKNSYEKASAKLEKCLSFEDKLVRRFLSVFFN